MKLAAQYRRIGEVYKTHGRLHVALSWCTREMHIRMSLFGAQHCAMSCFNVAQLQLQFCNYDAALPLYLQAVECHALAAHGGQVEGETLHVASALSEMALIYEHKGEYDKAWELSVRAADRGRTHSAPELADVKHESQVDNLILKIQDRLRTRKRLTNIWTTLRHGVSDWDPLWIPDTEVSACNVCSTRFSMLRRRHHCRMCGHVVCSTCSHHPRGKRVCTACRSGHSNALTRHALESPDPLDALDKQSHPSTPPPYGASPSASIHVSASKDWQYYAPPLGAASSSHILGASIVGAGSADREGGGDGAEGVEGGARAQTTVRQLTAARSHSGGPCKLTIPDFTAENQFTY